MFIRKMGKQLERVSIPMQITKKLNISVGQTILMSFYKNKLICQQAKDNVQNSMIFEGVELFAIRLLLQSNNRILIPKFYRIVLKINNGDENQIDVIPKTDCFYIRKVKEVCSIYGKHENLNKESCSICGKHKNLNKLMDDFIVCNKCKTKLTNILLTNQDEQVW